MWLYRSKLLNWSSWWLSWLEIISKTNLSFLSDVKVAKRNYIVSMALCLHFVCFSLIVVVTLFIILFGDSLSSSPDVSSQVLFSFLMKSFQWPIIIRYCNSLYIIYFFLNAFHYFSSLGMNKLNIVSWSSLMMFFVITKMCFFISFH